MPLKVVKFEEVHPRQTVTHFRIDTDELTTPSPETIGWDQITGKPTTFPVGAHNHDDRYYTRTEMDAFLAALQADDDTLFAEIEQHGHFFHPAF